MKKWCLAWKNIVRHF